MIAFTMAFIMITSTVLVVVPEPIEGPPNPIPAVEVGLYPSNQRADVTDGMKTVVFDGAINVEKIDAFTCTVTLTGENEHDWTMIISPEVHTFSTSGSSTFTVSLDVPKGAAKGNADLVVISSAKVPVLAPIISSASAVVTVIDTSEPPKWTLRILEPLEGAIVEGNTVTVSGTVSYEGGNITSVEVKACTGPWVRAEGTSDWTIESDMSLLDDGLHLISVRARSSDKTSPLVYVNITQDRSSTAVDPGGGDDHPPETPAESGWSTYDYLLMVVVVVAVLGIAYAYNRRRQMSTARSYLDRYGS